jgi:hypothetical protein
MTHAEINDEGQFKLSLDVGELDNGPVEHTVTLPDSNITLMHIESIGTADPRSC